MFLSNVSVYSGWFPFPLAPVSLPRRTAAVTAVQEGTLCGRLGHIRSQTSDLRASQCQSWKGRKPVVVKSFLSFNICSSNKILSKNPVKQIQPNPLCLAVREEEAWRGNPVLWGPSATRSVPTTKKSGASCPSHLEHQHPSQVTNYTNGTEIQRGRYLQSHWSGISQLLELNAGQKKM